MTTHKPNNYFDSVNDFLDNGHRLLVLHEVNVNDANVEEFFLLLNKKSINSNTQSVFDKLSADSFEQIKSLSKATQLFITSKDDNFFFIHLASMPYTNETKKEMISKDQEYISENFKEVLSTAFPFLTTEAVNETISPRSRSVRVPDLQEETTTQIKVAMKEIKKDANELVQFTQNLIEEKSKEAAVHIQKALENSQPFINKISDSKSKLFQISSSIKDGLLKQHKIIQKMKK